MKSTDYRSWEAYRDSNILHDKLMVPIFNVKDSMTQYCIEAKLPLFRSNEVELKIIDNTLTIRGQRVKLVNDIDSSFNSFQRTFVLPKNIIIKNVKPIFKNEQLIVSFSKKTENN